MTHNVSVMWDSIWSCTDSKLCVIVIGNTTFPITHDKTNDTQRWCDVRVDLIYSRYKLVCICDWYGVASVSRIDKIIGLICRKSSLLYVSFAKETYNWIDPTNRSHPITQHVHTQHNMSTHISTHMLCYGVWICCVHKATPQHNMSTPHNTTCTSSLLYVSFAKETYNLIDPTNRSHPITQHVQSHTRSSISSLLYVSFAKET